MLLIGIVESKTYIQGSVRFNVFYSSLSRHGEWIESDWGYAWRPMHVVHGWRPYLHGRWVWTDYGWYWVSHEPFGWATFHYGRWHYDDYYGWIWIPGYDWGPAWVEWRYDNDYIGWAPLPPLASFSISVGISFSSHWIAPIHYWNFIPCHNFTSARVIDYVQPVERARRIYGNTRSGVSIRGEHNRVINRGIDVSFVERRINTRVNRVDVIQRDRGEGERLIRDGRTERIEVYRPNIDYRNGTTNDRLKKSQRRDQENKREGSEKRKQEDARQSIGHDAERKRGSISDQTTVEPRIDNQRPQRDVQRERRQSELQQKNQEIQRMREQQRDKLEQRKNEQRKVDQRRTDQRVRETPRPERSESQTRESRQQRERSTPSPRQENSQKSNERKRRP